MASGSPQVVSRPNEVEPMTQFSIAVSLGALLACAGLVGCGGHVDGDTSSSNGTSGSSSSGSSSTGGSSSAGASSGSSSGGSTSSSGGSNGASTGASSWSAGNPDGACRAGVPAGGTPVDTSHPTSVVGTGTPQSCTFAKLSAAVAQGGVITFDCGAAPVTLAVTATLNVPTDIDTVIDGARKVTLDGQGAVQILSFDSGNWQHDEHRLTLQHLALQNAKATPTDAIPTAPAPCSQGWDDGQGGAVYMRDGNLTVIDCIFTGNRAAPLGPDTGGGAIYVQGSKHGVLIVGSSFIDNAASNAAAVGGLFTELDIYDSLFTGNTAVGSGANNVDGDHCAAMNNGQNEVGSGGNGGAIYSDGNSVNVALCGDRIVGNAAGTGAFGGGLFFTSNNMQGTLSIVDTTMTGNTGGHWTHVSTGSVTNAGTAVGTNCQSITLQNDVLQGVP